MMHRCDIVQIPGEGWFVSCTVCHWATQFKWLEIAEHNAIRHFWQERRAA